MTRLIFAAMAVFGQLPLVVLHGLGWMLGSLLWAIPNGYRRMTVRQIDLCLRDRPAAERRRIARRSLIESAKAACEISAFWFGADWRLRRWLDDPAALEKFRREVLADGRGAIMLTPHQGAWEITSFFCGRSGPITALYKPQDSAADPVILRGRQRRAGVRLMPTDTKGVKAVLAALQRGEMAGILPDHDPPEGSGRFAPLFGMPAHTMDLVSKLAARGRVPVWYIVAERLSWGRGFRFHLLPAPDGIADAKHGTVALNAGLEECIRRWPQQYWWSYKRFRRRPEGSPDPYAGL
jgi:KDO2-lipid IV(A) lauroyltransferase